MTEKPMTEEEYTQHIERYRYLVERGENTRADSEQFVEYVVKWTIQKHEEERQQKGLAADWDV